ncbi:DUF6207 family protein [Streptomyces sp. NPDC004232]|uniref:DUF6207 family protein n=1 Tax=Streptomyces sp. NPDC004232 TaxID=3154454 RepID=UPI0033A357D0
MGVAAANDVTARVPAAARRSAATSSAQHTTHDEGEPGVRLRCYLDLRQPMSPATSGRAAPPVGRCPCRPTGGALSSRGAVSLPPTGGALSSRAEHPSAFTRTSCRRPATPGPPRNRPDTEPSRALRQALWC